HHDITRAQFDCDLLGGGLYIGKVGRVVVIERRRHRDDEGVGLGNVAGHGEAAHGNGTADSDGEVGLDEGGLAARNGFDGARIDVDAGDLHAARGKHGRGGQADVTHSDDDEI